jgi:hypothetical protein
MKLLVCDVEGTIFKARYRIEGMDYASTMWQTLAQSLGDECVRREKELCDFTTVLISGGFQELVQRAKRELNIPHGHGACGYFFDDEDGLLSSNDLHPCDFTDKYKYVKIWIDRYKLDMARDWVFVGDGKNDCDIASRAPISFALGGHPLLREIATYKIGDVYDEHASFAEVGEILGKLTEADYENGFERNKGRKQMEAIGKRQETQGKCVKKSKAEVLVSDGDYDQPPPLHLSEIIDDHAIALIGQRSHHNTSKELKQRHPDARKFRFVEANFEHRNNADYKTLKRREFIFVDVDCISHSQGWRVEELNVPFAKIRHLPGRQNDTDTLVRVMSNVLCRYFYE